MAKTVKFNLICDGNPVRTIEDLQNNFSIEDLLSYYENGLLLRWLDVRGYSAEYEKVSAIAAKDTMEIAKELVQIFEIETDIQKVEEDVYMLQYQEEQRELCALYEKRKFKRTEIIEDYSQGYRQCVNNILDHPKDAAVIKAAIAEMVKDFEWTLDLNHRELFYQLYAVSPLAIMCLLMNEETRKYYLPEEVKKDDGTVINDTELEVNADKKEMYQKIRVMISTRDFVDELGSDLISFAGETKGYWKDLEPKGTRFMIIRMGDGDYIRASGVHDGDLSRTDIWEKFVIIDGIDYKSNSNDRWLRYMKVEAE